MKKKLPTVLSVAGSDSSGGAGVQADLLTFANRGVWGTTAFTALTAQNPNRVSAVHAVPAKFLKAQLETVAETYQISAMKTGMLGSKSAIETIVEFHKNHGNIQLVVDPVMIATSGAKLLPNSAMGALTKKLFPRATLITPNLDEAEKLLGAPAGTTLDEFVASAIRLFEKFNTAILLKGGHATGTQIVDILVEPNGNVSLFKHKRVKNINTHGSGCTLSAAITAELAKGKNLCDAVQNAIEYLQSAMKNSAGTQLGNFIAHLQ